MVPKVTGSSSRYCFHSVSTRTASARSNSWVDVKGNGWTVVDNVGTGSTADGFQVHEVVDGWGRDTVFSGNKVEDVAGLAINAAGPRAMRNSTTVACDNDAEGAADGRS